jgi:phenylpropionate dioxygenase-like ring-hydroxylating dioxygenase large terminal subunit
VDFNYYVPRPDVIYLRKTNPVHQDKRDVVALFVQMTSEEHCVAHMLCAYLPDGLEVRGMREFGQIIFAQDKTILENEIPKRLPLRETSEISARADAASVAYRRWLSASGIRYGVIPAQ